ncbi:predicted protein [Nematostella vectensis]|uniref:Large ribosomal subunit protein uL10m n=1 Tax=Nematostella vectensis TaxID=45351 RepID=A7S299_NEMVE|nr:predicted protein [Nematostella vectensis]|eukprot:XP_001634311.1 predicted protein [Nematostella vectensis]
MAARAVGLTSNKGLTFFVRAFNDCALRSASSMAAVRQPRKMAARCRAGKNKLRQAKVKEAKSMGIKCASMKELDLNFPCEEQLIFASAEEAIGRQFREALRDNEGLRWIRLIVILKVFLLAERIPPIGKKARLRIFLAHELHARLEKLCDFMHLMPFAEIRENRTMTTFSNPLECYVFVSNSFLTSANILRQKIKKPSQKKLEIVSNVREVFGNSCVTVFQYGDMNTAEWEDLRYALSKHNVKVKIFPNRVTHKALEDTIYDGIIPLFACTTCVIYSEEPAVKPILDVIKRQPKLELLGAKIDNRLMSVRNVQDFAKLPSLTELHVTLVQLLQHQSNQLGSLLQQNQSQLSSNLDQLVKQGGEQQ